MKKYLELNAKYYAYMLRIKAYKKVAQDYYNAGLIIPTTLIFQLNDMEKKRAEMHKELSIYEEKYCALMPIEIIIKMIETGKTYSIN